MKRIAIKKNKTIFSAGDVADSVYLIISGEIGIFLPTNTSEKPDFTLGENEIFGEMGVIDKSLRAGRADAITDVNLVRISQNDFNDKLAKSDLFILGLIRVLVTRLRDLLKRNVPDKTIDQVVEKSNQDSES